MEELVKILMYIARCVLIGIGGGVGLIKLVKGKSEENPKTMYEGFVTLGSVGVLFAATFVISYIFKI